MNSCKPLQQVFLLKYYIVLVLWKIWRMDLDDNSYPSVMFTTQVNNIGSMNLVHRHVVQTTCLLNHLTKTTNNFLIKNYHNYY